MDFFLFCRYCLDYVCLRTLTFLLKLISFQVFAQYSATSNDPDHEGEFSKSKKHILKGPVVITRNPCLHPGDVRQLTAVYAAQLVHLVDCVVFPNHGPRPHPSEMAGITDVSNYFWSFSIDHQVSSKAKEWRKNTGHSQFFSFLTYARLTTDTAVAIAHEQSMEWRCLCVYKFSLNMSMREEISSSARKGFSSNGTLIFLVE